MRIPCSSLNCRWARLGGIWLVWSRSQAADDVWPGCSDGCAHLPPGKFLNIDNEGAGKLEIRLSFAPAHRLNVARP